MWWPRWSQRARDFLRLRHPVGARRDHLRAAFDWLCRAQDATPDDGVSRSYLLRYSQLHKRSGWLASYPETTGYLIPTFYDYAALTGDASYRERAERMARWEVEVQMPSGAVQGGVIDFEPVPTIFNTGQVMFGFARAYRETGDPRYLPATRAAGEFLVSVQDENGAWSQHSSPFARMGINVYDVRTAWGLLVGALVTEEARHRDAAIRNFDYALTRQQENGWWEECSHDDLERPLLHSIAYTMEGLLEAGVILADDRYVNSARRAADALLAVQRSDGSLSGRYDGAWRAGASWSCVTGDAQTSIVWLRLYELTRERRYLEGARRINRYIASTQDLRHSDPGIRGAIKGSDPIYGDYATDEFPNWAAKFYADALLHEIRLAPNEEW
jgi:uncharacterized protein YyaL (SSP411 family)